MKSSSHLLVLVIVALAHVALYMAILTSHNENMTESAAIVAPTAVAQLHSVPFC